MRQAIISNTHTNHNFNVIYNYLKSGFLDRYGIDSIAVNGGLLGAFEIKSSYGYGYPQQEFLAAVDRIALLKNTAPHTAQKVMECAAGIARHNVSDDLAESIGKAALDYMDERYMWLTNALRMLSRLRKTYYNMGTHESPFYFMVLQELAFFMDTSAEAINRCIDLTAGRDIFGNFKHSLILMEKAGSFIDLSGTVHRENNVLFAGIPGLGHTSQGEHPIAKMQEAIAAKVAEGITNLAADADYILIYNHTSPKSIAFPFIFEPGSPSVQKMFDALQHTPQKKLFVQSYNHWITTHFFRKQGWDVLLNNAGVNNSLFNVVEIGSEMRCLDIDPNIGKIREISGYDISHASFSTPSERLRLNYSDADEVIKERQLDNGYMAM